MNENLKSQTISRLNSRLIDICDNYMAVITKMGVTLEVIQAFIDAGEPDAKTRIKEAIALARVEYIKQMTEVFLKLNNVTEEIQIMKMLDENKISPTKH